MSINELFPIEQWDFRRQSILADLPKEDEAALFANYSEHSFGKGDVVFREGGYPSGIYYIKSGKAKKYKLVRGSEQQIIYVANAGEIIGYHAILSDERYPDSAAALEESVIGFITRQDFIAVLRQSPVLTGRLLKLLSHEFTVLTNNMALFSHGSVRERFALQLVVLREKYKENFQPGMPVEISLSREDLANVVGTGRENIIRILSEFKELGILETNGRKIIVKDVKMLIEIANYH